MKKKITIAVSGASGAIYARQLIERLSAIDAVDLTVVWTANGHLVMGQEEGWQWFAACRDRVQVVDAMDFSCSLASGSGHDEALVIVPCSMGMLARVATGQSVDLITRGADVMLKERRQLILVVREAPYHLTHLRNMAQVTEAGAVIVPASPSFYSKPATVAQLCATVTDRVMRLLHVEEGAPGWGEKA